MTPTASRSDCPTPVDTLPASLSWLLAQLCQGWHSVGASCSASAQLSLPAALHNLWACVACRALVAWLQGLLRLGAQLDARDKGGGTPLFQSCEAGHATCTKVLLAAGADAQLSNAAGALLGAWCWCPALLVLQAAGASSQLSSVAPDLAALLI